MIQIILTKCIFFTRTIGRQLNQIEQQIPQFGQKLVDLGTDYKKVSAYFEDIVVDHEKTFFLVIYHLENEEERRIKEKEMKISHPIKVHRCHKEFESNQENRDNTSGSAKLYKWKKSDVSGSLKQKQDIPSWVFDKYRSVYIKTFI